MSLDDFWNGDCDLLFAYQKAYINKVHKQSHIQGIYNSLAFSTVIGNMFKKKDAKPIEYPQYDVFNPFSDANIDNNNKSVLNKIDTSKNNNGIFEQIEKLMRERRKD